jgi:predicted ATPase/class 3 adenylate cyclase
VRTDLPSGTVTLLFTDVEGSSRLLHELGAAAYAEALLDHRRRLREAFARHGGVEVDTEGDAFFVVFPTAAGALAAAADAQRALLEGPIRVRMGAHTGTPHLTDEGYVGHDVHLAARVGAAGHGGQVLVTRETRAQLEEGAALTLIDLGEHRLKDIAQPVWIYQLGNGSFPPLKSISNTNLPRPPSPFVGREREREEVTALLRNGTRLLTLTGPGGTGKTRLSVEAAGELVPEFRNGTFWVNLAPLRSSDLVLPTVAATLGAKEDLADYIGERQMLLVLDNLEQVIECGPELGRLVEQCPNLRVMATSRSRLRVKGETEYAVPPLTDDEAVAMFVERSGRGQSPAIGELCRRLDNLPLAIELAAARASVMSPPQLLERLSRRLDLLRGGRDAEARQQTLRATLEWSHDLLTEAERLLFARFAVFAGGWSLDAAERVGDAQIDTLQELVDKNLVLHVDERFDMLETIREFALEKATDLPDCEELRARHAAFYLAFVEAAEPALSSGDPGAALRRLEIEHDNIRAALAWFDATGGHESALRLAGAVWEFWCLRGHAVEGRRHLERLLHSAGEMTPTRLKALTGAVHLAAQAGVPHEQARREAEEALAAARAVGDEQVSAYSQVQLAGVLVDSAAGDDRTTLMRAVELFESAIPVLRASGAEHQALQATRSLAFTYGVLGDDERYVALNTDNLERARAAGNKLMEARALASLGAYAGEVGRLDEALDLLLPALELDRQNGHTWEVVLDLYRMCQAFGNGGQPLAAAWVAAAGDALADQIGITLPGWGLEMRDAGVTKARSMLSATDFDAAALEARALSPEAAVDRALAAMGRGR